jgi:hypothetical protein
MDNNAEYADLMTKEEEAMTILLVCCWPDGGEEGR